MGKCLRKLLVKLGTYADHMALSSHSILSNLIIRYNYEEWKLFEIVINSELGTEHELVEIFINGASAIGKGRVVQGYASFLTQSSIRLSNVGVHLVLQGI